jgi:oligosaccharide repeat unit polymerase
MTTLEIRSLIPIPHALILVTVALLFAREHLLRQLDFMSPLSITLLAYTTMFAIVPLIDIQFAHPLASHEAWWRAAWLAWFGLVLAGIGYTLALATVPPRSRSQVSIWNTGRAAFWSTILMTIALTALLTQLGGFAGTAAYFSRFATRHGTFENPVPLLLAISLAAPAVLLQAGSWLSGRTWRRTLSVLLLWLPPALVLSTFLGQRWRGLAILVALAGVYHHGFRRITVAAFGILMAALAVAFVLFGLHRNIVGTRQEALSLSGRNLYYNYVGAGHEVGQFRDFLITIQGVPEQLPFQGGKTFISVIPGTPFPTGGYLYSTTFFPELYAEGTSIPTPLPGELYMNFGTQGILIGMALFGFLLGLVESYFQRHRNTIGAILVYSYSIVPLALIIRGEFTTFAGYWMVGLIPLFLTLRTIERRVIAERPPQEMRARQTNSADDP